MKQLLLLMVAAIMGGAIALIGFQGLQPVPTPSSSQAATNEAPSLFKRANYRGVATSKATDFTVAAETALPTVVHIKASKAVRTQRSSDPFEYFFGPGSKGGGGSQKSQGTGSGVIVSEDGYIVTNNHVIDGATTIEISLHDNHTYAAKVVGTDPSTDIALLKIDADDLDYVKFSDSDKLKVGEWVIAVGNPFNLASTVTAGIVSAKGRNINILQDQAAIESFIQTDAAVNPGNSGGALVNLEGELVVIYTAIATPTGVYAGYSFAVPSRIVHKVMTDLKQHGEVNRGYLGVTVQEVNSTVAQQYGLNTVQGVLVTQTFNRGAADQAGVEPGDVIVSVNGRTVNNSPDLLGYLGHQRPGDKVELTVLREGRKKRLDAYLKDRMELTR